ncbi:MAG: glycine--tRNA ligase [Gammaproteobacteria bacterium]|nr:glycine--tRNA ligase [Gammaproteobacteria bacterium]
MLTAEKIPVPEENNNTATKVSWPDLVSFLKHRGFLWISSDIYGGLAGFYDYGPLGTELKRNIRQAWWEDMVSQHNALETPEGAPSAYQMMGIESSIIMHPQVWKASGNYDLFNDQMVDCRETKKRYRYDHVRGRWVRFKDQKIFVTIINDDPDHEHALLEQRVLKHFKLRAKQADQLSWESGFLALPEIEDQSAVLAPEAKTLGTLTEPRAFNIMFKSTVGSTADEEDGEVYLRPETAQGMFTNFKNVLDTTRSTLPFGLAQIGKAFRNEITPRHMSFRSREFEQAEIEFFCHPDDSKQWFDYWRQRWFDWCVDLGISTDHLILRDHDQDELSHYSKGTVDVEYAFPFMPAGEYGELAGLAHRSDFDLRSHMEGMLDPDSNPLTVKLNDDGKPHWRGSGKNLQYRDNLTGETFTPHVVEPTIGLDRAFLAVLADAYQIDQAPDDKGEMKERTVLKLHPRLAPIKCAVLPLVKKDGMPDKAKQIYNSLFKVFPTSYDEKQSIGRRYRRCDEIGVPYCITIDGQTLEDDTVTIRDRDSLEQWRVKASDCVVDLTRRLAETS